MTKDFVNPKHLISSSTDWRDKTETPAFNKSVAVTAGILTGASLSFVNHWLLARHYGPYEYGEFSVAWAGAQMVIPILALGIPRLLLERFKSEGNLAVKWLYPSFRLMTLIGCLCAFCYWLWGAFFVSQMSTRITSKWLTFWLILMTPVIVVYSKFQIELKIPLLVLWPLLQISLRTLAICMSILCGLPIEKIAFGFVLVTFPLSVFAIKELRDMLTLQYKSNEDIYLRTSGFKPGISTILRSALPFGLTEVLEKIELKLIVPLAAYQMGSEAAGLVSVSVNLLVAIYLVPSALFRRYYLPYLQEWDVLNPKKKWQFLQKTILILGSCGLIMIPIIWVISSSVIGYLFGASYLKSVMLLKILSIGLPVWLISIAFVYMFLSMFEIKRLLAIQIICLIVTVVFAIFMAPLLGLAAFACALLLGRSLLVILSWFKAR